ncbi:MULTISPECIES: hypothetical protein [Eubacterium]|uniref:DUF8180 domain-containing protein n=1 Tax=Eubacterium barkeri TaxID=1528 RepID=A0A1H3EFS1_EUBBA|nr:hypothetical protein [Eubacterium barkeri]SDX77566.1 hypothetical protein SAMN04488579_10747 [Eubacterium barkeri]
MKPGDQQLFKVLITHWINHLEDHGTEYGVWSERVAGEYPGVSAEIKEAWEIMKGAEGRLMAAKVAFDRDQA